MRWDMAGSATETGSEVVRRRLEGGVFVKDKREDPPPRCDSDCETLRSLFDVIPWISVDREGCLKEVDEEESVPRSVRELDEPPEDLRKTKVPLLFLLLLLLFEGDGGLLLERFEGDPGEEDTGDW